MHQIVQLEIPVSSLEKAVQFYESAFDWLKSPTEMHQYQILDLPGETEFGVALVAGRSDQGAKSGVVCYLKCHDLEKRVRSIVEAGGKIHFGPKSLPPYGTIYQISDPDGNKWGLFAPTD